MNGAGEQGDAMPADLVAKVLAGDADRPRAGWFEDIPLKKLPLFSGGRRWHREGRGHRTKADTPVLLTLRWWVKESIESLGGQTALRRVPITGCPRIAVLIQ
jgi:hypothetical protein